MRDWKTSLVGVVLVLTGLALLKFGPEDHAIEGSAIIAAGVGFIVARDSNRPIPPPQDPPQDPPKA